MSCKCVTSFKDPNLYHLLGLHVESWYGGEADCSFSMFSRDLWVCISCGHPLLWPSAWWAF